MVNQYELISFQLTTIGWTRMNGTLFKEIPESIYSINWNTHPLSTVAYFNQYGQIHRDGLPALITPRDKAKELGIAHKLWVLNGSLHREDGPAVESLEDINNHNIHSWEKQWYHNGISYPFSEWLMYAQCSDERKVELKLIYS